MFTVWLYYESKKNAYICFNSISEAKITFRTTFKIIVVLILTCCQSELTRDPCIKQIPRGAYCTKEELHFIGEARLDSLKDLSAFDWKCGVHISV